ncbi:hypothetical protein A9Q84_16445 [Halobacteriovorax marinus]|uniref:AsmA-like C-terminal domain-containing protein n=1 Tax=Halobacteriovorax marinus TaxID=97084 RepID=A0A1Y5FAT9_9BACT|nr:hypothetical protein A9Q84_16445 [Halobacteriovorax marinus]
MKALKFLAVLACLTPQTQAFELDINIENLDYLAPSMIELVSRKHVGSLSASRFVVKTPLANLVLKKEFRFDANILMNQEMFIFDNNMFELSYSLEAIPGVESISYSKIKNLTLFTNDSEIHLNGEFAQFNIDKDVLKFSNLELFCDLDKSLFAAPEALTESCLNSSVISSSNKEIELDTHIEYTNENSNLSFDIKDGYLTEEEMNVKTGLVVAKTGSTTFGAESIDIKCPKGHYTQDVSDLDVARICLTDANIKAPKLIFKDEERSIEGVVDIEELVANGEEMKFLASTVSIKNTDQNFVVKELSAYCKLPSLEEGFQYGDLAIGCMDISAIEFNSLVVENESTKVKLGKSKFDITEDTIRLESPRISFSDNEEVFSLDFLDSEIECKKITNEKEITLGTVLKGCFDSSKLLIPKIEIKHKDIETNISINKLSIDKQKLEFNSPRGVYSLNGLDNKYKDFRVSCELAASYDVAKDYDWQSILENCLHSSDLHLDHLVAVYNGDKFFKKFGAKLKTFGIKAINDVNFFSRNLSKDKFKLTISPKVLGFIPIHVTVNGKINFDREKSQIVIDIKKTRFYKIIPAKFLVQLVLKAFVVDERTKVEGDKIFISL